MEPVSLYAAIDGGNSKTDVLVGFSDGQVHSVVRGPGSSPHLLGVAGSIALLGTLLDEARTGVDGPLERVEIYLAGADLPIEVERLMTAVGEAGWASQYRVDNDTFAILRAGTDDPDAIGVVCGAGINCVGRTGDGRTARFPSLGPTTGDWGGGHHLSRLALYHAARGEDGRGPATALTRAIADHSGRSTVEELALAVHFDEVPEARLYELAPVLFAVADAGDPVARGVVAQQVDEVCALVRVAATRLGLLDRPYTVVLGGAVFRGGHALLNDAVAARIHELSPRATTTVLTRPPVLGAALYALDALGALPEAAAHLRAVTPS